MKPVATQQRLRIELDGEELPAASAAALAAVRVRQELSLPAQCELTFALDAAGGPHCDAAPGASLRLVVAGCEEPLFRGEVTAVERVYDAAGDHRLHLRAYDLLHRLRKRQPLKAHVELTPLDLARELASGLGLTAAGTTPGPRRPLLLQYRDSDFDLLRGLCEASGLFFTLLGDELRLLTLDGCDEPLPLLLGESLLEARFETNADRVCRTVEVHAWDPQRAEPRGGRAAAPRLGRTADAAVEPQRVGATALASLAAATAASDDQAAALAQAALDRRAAQEVTLAGVAEGDPRLRPGTRVEVSGAAPRLCGQYVLTAVVHSFAPRRGYLSEISTAPPAPRRQSGAAAATLGVVTRVDDPERRGRVCASLPAYGDLETGWMGVLAAGAGKGKGLVALPDTGDNVLVLLLGQDPAQGVVLGGLYGAGGAEDGGGVAAGAVRRYHLRTPGGQHVVFDDEQRSLRLEDASGSYLELTPQVVRLHAAVDLHLEAPGRGVVIRGQTVDFERA